MDFNNLKLQGSLMQVKTKVALIASAITVCSMFAVSIITWKVNKTNALKSAIEAQANELRVVDMLIERINKDSKASILSLVTILEQIPPTKLSSKNDVIYTTGPIFKLHQEASRTSASYIGLPSGEIVTNTIFENQPYKDFGIIGGEGSDFDVTKRPWYIGAVEKKGLFQTDVYIDVGLNIPVVSYVYPIFRNNALVFVAGVDIPLSSLQEHFDDFAAKNNADIFIMGENNIPFAASNHELIFKDDVFFKQIRTLSDSTADFEDFTIEHNGVTQLAQCKTSKDTQFALYTLCSMNPLANTQDPIIKLGILQFALGFAFAIIAGLILYVVISRLLSPLHSISNAILAFFAYLNHEKTQVQTLNIPLKMNLARLLMPLTATLKRPNNL